MINRGYCSKAEVTGKTANQGRGRPGSDEGQDRRNGMSPQEEKSWKKLEKAQVKEVGRKPGDQSLRAKDELGHSPQTSAVQGSCLVILPGFKQLSTQIMIKLQVSVMAV